MLSKTFTNSSLSLLALVPVLYAQPVLTPTPSTSAAGAPFEWGSYTIANSVETGYRFTTIGGDASLFHSAQNYGTGLRLFGASLTANSRDGRGPLFDSLSLTASGLGNDPYGMASLHLEKNRLFRYDMTWRRHEYSSASQLNGGGATLKNTRRALQEHDLTLYAAKGLNLLLGYTRNHETGPEFTSYETYIGGLARSVLPLDRDTRRDFNEYRLGATLDFFGFKLTLTHRREYYKDDSAIASLVPGLPYPADFLLNLPFDPSLERTYPQAAAAYARSQPWHSRTSGWFGNLSRNAKYWAVNARITYSKADSTTVYFETESGASQAAATVPTGDGRSLNASNSGFGAPVTAYTYMPGSARRPFLAGDFSFSVFPTPKLTIVNSTSVQSNRYDGSGNELRVLSNSSPIVNRYWTYHLGTGRVSDALDLNYKVNRWLGLNAEYRYTSRFIDNNLTRTGTTNSRDLNSVRNHLNTATFGFRLKPLKPLSLSLDTTVGRDNGPENPTSPAHFHNLRGRMDYRTHRLRLGLTYRQMYNLNAPLSVPSISTGQLLSGAPLDYYTSHSRDLSATASYEASRRLALDVTYSKAHLDTLANLWAELVPQGSATVSTVSVRGYVSQYISNVQTVSLIARTTWSWGKFYAGYNISRDGGDGRAIQNLGLTDLAAAYTAAWATFPMTYQAPMARLSVRLSPKIQWNGGWEFYRYNQKFAYFGYQPYYRAHTGYSSLSLSF